MDVASAQLAASALLTSEQVLAFKAKEDTPPGGGVNGVLPPSGNLDDPNSLTFRPNQTAA